MRTKTDQRRARYPAPHRDREDLALLPALEDEAPCSNCVVMSQASGMPALEEYLRELGSRTIH